MKFLVFFALAMVLANTAPAVEARGRMYNAYDVSPNQFPSLARLEAFLNPYVGKCSGTLIRKDFVLTAAHCAYVNRQKPTEMRVFLGSPQVNGPLEESVTVNSINDDIIVHEDYDYFAKRNDIALIRIPDVDTKENIGVSPLPMPSDYASCQVQAAGFGVISDSRQTSSFAQWNSFTIYSNDNCPTPYAGLVPSHLCLYNKVSAPCPGDSGGPALCNDKVVGVASFISGDGCESNNAIVYTNVSYFRDWIQEKMDTPQIVYRRYELKGTVHSTNEV